MTTTSRNKTRGSVFVALVRDFASDAREQATAVPPGSCEWQFYRGVQMAAADVLHADVAQLRAHDARWLSTEDRSFRDGYLTASAILEAAAVAPEGRGRVVLPVLQRAAR